MTSDSGSIAFTEDLSVALTAICVFVQRLECRQQFGNAKIEATHEDGHGAHSEGDAALRSARPVSQGVAGQSVESVDVLGGRRQTLPAQQDQVRTQGQESLIDVVDHVR